MVSADYCEDIPRSWEAQPLATFADINMGQSPPSSTYNKNGEGLPFFQGRKDFGQKYPNVTCWCSEPKKIADKGDVLLSVRAPIGDVNIAKYKTCIGRGLASIKMKNGNNEFLYYLLKCNSSKISSTYESGGTVFGCLTKDDLEKLRFLIPKDDKEQKMIAQILTKLDGKIISNQYLNMTLEEISKVLFKHWFVDFEFLDENDKPYRSSGGKMVESELGNIPEGWEIKNLMDVADFTRGFSYKGSEKRDDGELLFITLNSIYEGGGFKREFCYIESGRLKARHFIDEGDIIITNTEQTKRGTLIGFPALVEFPHDYGKEKKAVFSHHITKIIQKKVLSKYYLLGYLFHNQKRTVGYSTGSVILGLDVSNWMKNEKIILPNSNVLRQYHELMDSIFHNKLINNKESEVLTGIRESILPKLMSGKIRVPVSNEVSESP